MARLTFTVLLFLLSGLAHAADRTRVRVPVDGPVEADLISVIDGDTLLVEARPWPQHAITVLVRIRGIDAPELKAKCPVARHAANRAREELAHLAARGPIRLTNIAGDKYFGRVVADVSTDGADDVGASLLARGLVQTYDGGRKSAPRC